MRLEDDHDGSTYAYGETTFTRIPRQGDAGADLAALVYAALKFRITPSTVILAEEVGVEIENCATTEKCDFLYAPELLNPRGGDAGSTRLRFLVEVAGPHASERRKRKSLKRYAN